METMRERERGESPIILQNQQWYITINYIQELEGRCYRFSRAEKFSQPVLSGAPAGLAQLILTRSIQNAYLFRHFKCQRL